MSSPKPKRYPWRWALMPQERGIGQWAAPHNNPRRARGHHSLSAAASRGIRCLTLRRRSTVMVSRRSGMSSTTLRNGRADMARHTPEAEKPAPLPVTKLEPTEAEQAEILAHAERKKARRRAPRLAVHQQEGSRLQVMPAGARADAAGARLMNALGTTDLDLAECVASQIVNAANLQASNEPVSVATLNAALAAV